MTRKTDSNLSNIYHGKTKRKTVTQNGKEYTYWSCRVYYTDQETGKRKDRLLLGKSQHKVQDKLNALIASGQTTNKNVVTFQAVTGQG